MKSKNKSTNKIIISGKFKGKRLKLPSKESTRSSKTIVLESFFNTIQFEVVDAVFVELFSGSGSIGLEALSRGASSVIFMEQDRDALQVLKGNIALTDPSLCKVYAGDSFINIKTVVKELVKRDEEAYFYIDPPFSIRDGMEDVYDKMIALIASLPEENVKLIVIEHMTGLELPQTIKNFTQSKSKKFGNTTLTYFK